MHRCYCPIHTQRCVGMNKNSVADCNRQKRLRCPTNIWIKLQTIVVVLHRLETKTNAFDSFADADNLSLNSVIWIDGSYGCRWHSIFPFRRRHVERLELRRIWKWLTMRARATWYCCWRFCSHPCHVAPIRIDGISNIHNCVHCYWLWQFAVTASWRQHSYGCHCGRTNFILFIPAVISATSCGYGGRAHTLTDRQKWEHFVMKPKSISNENYVQ